MDTQQKKKNIKTKTNCISSYKLQTSDYRTTNSCSLQESFKCLKYLNNHKIDIPKKMAVLLIAIDEFFTTLWRVLRKGY